MCNVESQTAVHITCDRNRGCRTIPSGQFPRTIPHPSDYYPPPTIPPPVVGRTFPSGQFPNMLYIHTYTCMHTHTHIHTYIHTIHTCIYTHTYTYIHIHT